MRPGVLQPPSHLVVILSREFEHMKRDLLLRHLAQAEQSVAEAKALIANQQRLIVESERDGRDVAEKNASDETALTPG
jgi:hypothetical protein